MLITLVSCICSSNKGILQRWRPYWGWAWGGKQKADAPVIESSPDAKSARQSWIKRFLERWIQGQHSQVILLALWQHLHDTWLSGGSGKLWLLVEGNEWSVFCQTKHDLQRLSAWSKYCCRARLGSDVAARRWPVWELGPQRSGAYH